ncbi:MAG TPA: carbohydrate ABC transporter permease, partial [Ramlibacter sp.]|nr:carbohydrate ABC transporter permease [Ramlibacter sp.]
MRASLHSPLEPTALSKWFAGSVVVAYAVLSLIPLVWIFATSFRTPSDAIAYPPKLMTQPSLVGYVNLFTTRSRVSQEELQSLPPPATWYEKVVRDQQMILAGPSRFSDRYLNSLEIGFGSTLLSVVLGTLAG